MLSGFKKTLYQKVLARSSGFGRPYSTPGSSFSSRFGMNEKYLAVRDSHWEYVPPKHPAKVLVTCEHASNRFPQQYFKEKGLMDTHWASDIGAEDVAGLIAGKLNFPMIASRVSRLVIDVNRPLNSDTLFRTTAEGQDIPLNKNMSPEDKQDRIDRYWKTYRYGITTLMEDNTNIKFVLSVHSYTPNYEGEIRECEVGVLFIDSKNEGTIFAEEFAKRGYKTVVNEPWPGSICDVIRTTNKSGVPCVLLEVRNDLAKDSSFQTRFVNDVSQILEKLGLAKPQL